MVTRTPGSAPVALRLAAAAQAAEAVGLCVAGVFSAISTADGKSYELASGVALTVIAFSTAVALAAFAVALDRARPWSRTPVVMTQVFVIIGGFTLLDGHRPEWGWPALALAVGALAGLFAPASLRALNRPPSAPDEAVPGPSQPSAPSQTAPAKTPPAKRPPAKNQSAQHQSNKGQPNKGQPNKGQPTKGQPSKRQPTKQQATKQQATKQQATKRPPAKNPAAK